MALNTRLETLIQPVVESIGYELWGIEFKPRGKDSLLRVYIDSPQGVDVEACAKVSSQVSAVLDVEDPISEHYSLEISSPGLDRPLFKLSQFVRYIGEELKLSLLVPIAKRRKIKAELVGVEEKKLLLLSEKGESYEVPFHQVRHAHLIYKI